MLLDVSVCAARLERLRTEIAVARFERDDAVVRAAAAGAARIQIAERLGVSRKTVWALLRAS